MKSVFNIAYCIAKHNKPYIDIGGLLLHWLLLDASTDKAGDEDLILYVRCIIKVFSHPPRVC
jgi:hypothetical protein